MSFVQKLLRSLSREHTPLIHLHNMSLACSKVTDTTDFEKPNTPIPVLVEQPTRKRRCVCSMYRIILYRWSWKLTQFANNVNSPLLINYMKHYILIFRLNYTFETPRIVIYLGNDYLEELTSVMITVTPWIRLLVNMQNDWNVAGYKKQALL